MTTTAKSSARARRSKTAAKAHPACQGFAYQSADRRPSKPTRVWFKSRLRVLHADGWYTYSVGKQK